MSIEYTSDPDIITLDSDPRNKRFKMLYCGHALTAASLKTYFKKELSSQRYPVQCPGYFGNVRCTQMWDLDVFKRYIAVSSMETKQLEEDIQRIKCLKSPSKIECPKCKSVCERSNKIVLKVCCGKCKNGVGSSYSFCWCCLQEWRGSDTISCGNKPCPGMHGYLQRLSKSPRKTIGEVAGCPSLRACPHCNFVIEHGGDCKHMVCPNCHQKFCFVCLSKPDNKGYYPCGGYFTVCSVAAIQTYF